MRLILAAFLAVLTFGRPGPGMDVLGTATVRGKPIADAVVWFDAPGAPAAPVRPKVVLDQRNIS